MSYKVYTDGQTCSECSEPAKVKGYCHTHYNRARSLQNPARKSRLRLDDPIERKVDNIVVGPDPGDNEKAVYYLRRTNQEPFYVGSTVAPRKRLVRHRKNFGYEDVEMVVLRLCQIGEEVYWVL